MTAADLDKLYGLILTYSYSNNIMPLINDMRDWFEKEYEKTHGEKPAVDW